MKLRRRLSACSPRLARGLRLSNGREIEVQRQEYDDI